MIASEPITEENWIELPEGSVIGIDSDARNVNGSLVSAVSPVDGER